MERKIDFFISYTRADEAWAKKIARFLENNGYTAIYQARDAKAETSVMGFIEKAFQSAWNVIAVCSNSYFRSKFAVKEYRTALDLKIKEEIREFYTIYVQNVDESKIPRVLFDCIRTKLYGLEDESAQEQALLDAINHPAFTERNPFFPLRKLSIDIRSYELQKRYGLSAEGLCQFLLTKAAKDYQELQRYREAWECWTAIAKWCRSQRPSQENSAYMCDESAFTCKQLAIYQRANLEVDVEHIPEVESFKHLLGILAAQALEDGKIEPAVYYKRIDATLCDAEAKEYPDNIKRVSELQEGIHGLKAAILVMEKNLRPSSRVSKPETLKKIYNQAMDEYFKRARTL